MEGEYTKHQEESNNLNTYGSPITRQRSKKFVEALEEELRQKEALDGADQEPIHIKSDGQSLQVINSSKICIVITYEEAISS